MATKKVTTPSDLAALALALRHYAPARCAKFQGAKGFAVLDKLVEVPAALRALWSWVDGADEIIVPGESDEAIDLMSVAQSARALMQLRKGSAFPADLVPFATDGAGNFTALDERGRVLDWDHETCKTRAIAPSLAKLLGRTMTAITKNELFGGPEAPKGNPHPLAKRAQALLARPVANQQKIRDLLARFPPKLASEAFRIGIALRDAVLAQEKAQWREDDCVNLALLAANVHAWDDAIAALIEKDNRSAHGTHDWWFVVGRKALEAGAFEHAAKACAKGDSIPAAVGALVARVRLGEKVTDVAETAQMVISEIARMEEDLAKDAKTRPKPNPDSLRYVAGLYIHSATLARVAGDSAAADAAVTKARRYWKRMDTVDTSLAKAMGVRLVATTR